jgi:nitrate reductase gamma subunit
MKLRNLYLLNSVICLVFAIGFLLMPSITLNLFGMDYTKDAAMLGQLIAVELVVGGLITLLARDVTDAKARTAINTGNMVAGVLGIVVALNGTLTGVFGWFGWVILAVYAFVAVAFAYFQFFAWEE